MYFKIYEEINHNKIQNIAAPKVKVESGAVAWIHTGVTDAMATEVAEFLGYNGPWWLSTWNRSRTSTRPSSLLTASSSRSILWPRLLGAR